MTPGNGNPAKSTHVCVSPFLRNGCQSRLSPYHLHYTSRSLWKVEVARAWTKSRHKSCLSVIDLGITRRFKERDKRGGRLLLAEVKRLCFPDNYRLTTKVCEAFFDDDSNFDLDRDPVAEEASCRGWNVNIIEFILDSKLINSDLVRSKYSVVQRILWIEGLMGMRASKSQATSVEKPAFGNGLPV